MAHCDCPCFEILPEGHNISQVWNLGKLKPKCRSTGCCSRTEWISGRKSRPGLTLTMIYQLSRPLTRLVTNSDRLQACEVCRCRCCVAKIQTSAFQEITSILTELRRVQRQLEGELSGTTCSHTHTHWTQTTRLL